MSLIDTVIFDLDGVLYDERQYFYAAFAEIADFLSKKSKFSQHQIRDKLWADFQKKSSIYPHLFNDLLTDYDIDKNLLTDILTLFSTVKPNLKLYHSAELLLKTLRNENFKLGLLTNGNVETQRNKVRLLKIEDYFNAIVYARQLGAAFEKPNTQAFEAVLSALSSKPEKAIYLGDNPYTDFVGAKQLGIKTIRLLSGEFRGVHLGLAYEADFVADNLDHASRIILKIQKSGKERERIV